MDPASLTADLKTEALRLGFGLVGVCPAVTPQGLHHFYQWLARGYAGEMRYLPDRADAYSHPRHVLDGARSVVVVAMPYCTSNPQEPSAGEGRISRYAWGSDYHDLMRDRLAGLRDFLTERAPDTTARGVVDTAPLAEREFAQLAGLGWIGKNTLLLNRQLGSWFFLGALLTSAGLIYDQPHETNHCGTCRACLDACPTDAFVAPYVLDARKCLSYLTIEHRSPIDRELRPGLQDWLFGCDVCQSVCPWNNHAPMSAEAEFLPRQGNNPVDLVPFFYLSETQFRECFRHTPLWRPKRRGLLRNAAIVLGNQAPWTRRAAEIEAALVHALDDAEPLVRGAAVWALTRHGSTTAIEALKTRRVVESHPDVQAELAAALAEPLVPAVGQIHSHTVQV